MSEFKAADPEVRDIAAVFALKGWTWAVQDGKTVEPYVPKASDIARTLNGLYDTSTMGVGLPKNGGTSRTGRLWLSWIDEGYGHEVEFGIEWTRGPF